MYKTLLAVFLALAAFSGGLSAQESDFQVIVHPNNPATSLSTAQVTRLFLKQTTRWDHGGEVNPVDQLPASACRVSFSADVLERNVGAVESFWQQQIFSGRSAPPVKLGSDEAVVDYVKNRVGAIGYVTRNASTSGVKVLTIDG